MFVERSRHIGLLSYATKVVLFSKLNLKIAERSGLKKFDAGLLQ